MQNVAKIEARPEANLPHVGATIGAGAYLVVRVRRPIIGLTSNKRLYSSNRSSIDEDCGHSVDSGEADDLHQFKMTSFVAQFSTNFVDMVP